MKSFFTKLLSVLLITSLGVVVYSNAFHCSFHFDDLSSITDNWAIRNIHDLRAVWNYLPRRFILYLSIAFNYHFNKFDVFGYHIFNLTVHLITAVLVWWLTLLTLSTPAIKGKIKADPIAQHANLIALLVGLVFVSHPVQTQAVTYIVQRAASMATLFYVASLCFYIKARLLQEKEPSSVRAKIFYIFSLIIAVVAMFTKETAITLPLMILLYEFCFFNIKKRFNWGYSLPFLFIVFIIPMIMLLTETSSVRLQELRNEPGISSMHYLLTQFRVMVTYIRLIFIPLNQNLDYDYPVSKSILELPTLFSLLFLISILYLAKRLFLKYRLVSFSIFWFFLTLLPESSILPIRDVIYEHRLYLPLVGFSIFLVSGGYYLFQKKSINIMVALVTIFIVCNSLLTYQRNRIWKDEFTLWNDIVQKSPHKARPYNNRGNALYEQGNFTKALSDLNMAIAIDPNFADAYYSRGNAYLKQGDFARALLDYDKAIKLNPRDSQAYNNRGNIYDKQGDFVRAILNYNNAIMLNPNYIDAYYNRGYNYTEQGNFAKAISDFDKVIELNPKDAEAYNNRGLSYDREGKADQALLDYNKAIEIEPKYAGAYINRGSVYNKQGEFTQAMDDFSKAIEIDPKNVMSYKDRGGIYANQENFTQAIDDFNQAIEKNPKYADAYYSRGLAYDKQGDFVQAILDYNKAIELNPKFDEAYYNRGSVYDRQNKFTEALSDYGHAIEIDPNNAEAYNNRGVIYAKQNDFTSAISDFTKVIGIDSQNAAAYNNLGLIYDKQGKSEQAVAEYNKALEINSNYADAYYNRAIIYEKLSDFTKAVSDCTKAININPNYAGAYYNRAVNYYQLKQYVKAWADVHELEKMGTTLNPDFINALKQASGQDN